MRYDARNAKALEGLDPVAKAKFLELLAKLEEAGEEILIDSGYRSAEEQDALYAKGRTKTGKIVTNARAGYSLHNFGVAIDVVPAVAKTGELLWSGKESAKRYEAIVSIAKSIGIEWGGDWKSFPDKPHLQYTQGLTLADFRSGKTLQPETKFESPETLYAKAVNALKWVKGLRKAMIQRRIAQFGAEALRRSIIDP
ncbi:MAG: M15 family metallopeptidase [Pirellulales bacterium]